MKKGQSKITDLLIGMVYNSLTIKETPVSIYVAGKKRRHVKCECVCGKEVFVMLHSIMSGKTKSCGCVMLVYKDRVKAKKMRGAYSCMLQRCHNPKCKAYQLYGAKGIKVCDRWRCGFEYFYEDMQSTWFLGAEIDRHPNQKGDYELPNCRWATEKQQQRNKSNVVFNEEIILQIRQSKLLQPELAKIYNVNQSTISRIKNNKRWILN